MKQVKDGVARLALAITGSILPKQSIAHKNIQPREIKDHCHRDSVLGLLSDNPGYRKR